MAAFARRIAAGAGDSRAGGPSGCYSLAGDSMILFTASVASYTLT
jgi:hypothetical protein